VIREVDVERTTLYEAVESLRSRDKLDAWKLQMKDRFMKRSLQQEQVCFVTTTLNPNPNPNPKPNRYANPNYHPDPQLRAAEMCKELAEAKDKVTQMEHVVRTAERNVDVIRIEQRELSASLAGNVGKINKLLVQAKAMRQHRADMQVDIQGGRRRHKFRLEVS
jgi:hypothetical protein